MENLYNNITDLDEKIKCADCVLVGIGNEIENGDEDETVYAYNCIAQAISGKNYFVVSECSADFIFKSELDSKKVTVPLHEDEGIQSEEGKESDKAEKSQWDTYLLWLSCTLNRKLLIIELGAGLITPQIIRWPFEKTTLLNKKAELIRINGKMPNIPAEIRDRAIAVDMNAYEFVCEV